MNDPPRRLTVRRMMLCVALMGLMVADLMKSRRDTYRETAAHAVEEERSYRIAESRLREAARARPLAAVSLRAAADLQRRRADWHAAKGARNDRAAEAPGYPSSPTRPHRNEWQV